MDARVSPDDDAPADELRLLEALRGYPPNRVQYTTPAPESQAMRDRWRITTLRAAPAPKGADHQL